MNEQTIINILLVVAQVVAFLLHILQSRTNLTLSNGQFKVLTLAVANSKAEVLDAIGHKD